MTAPIHDDGPRRILVFRIGHLGDTIIALPAFWALRARFPLAQMTLLCGLGDARGLVNAADVVAGTGIFHDHIVYPAPAREEGRPSVWSLARLALKLRLRRYDLAVHLGPSRRTQRQVDRDVAFFRWCGIPRIVGCSYPPPETDARPPGTPMPMAEHETDRLLARLRSDGIPVPAPQEGSMSLGISAADHEPVMARVAASAPDGGRRWVAIGPGSKMPAKVWPEERYAEAVRALIAERDVWPVILGGGEDVALGDRLLAIWGRGHNLAGMSVRSSVAAMERCALYLGNDTGTMHLAVSAGIRCIAIFSARDQPGRWYPYGHRHIVLRRAVACEGCLLKECVAERMRCLTGIPVDEVTRVCRDVLDGSSG